MNVKRLWMLIALVTVVSLVLGQSVMPFSAGSLPVQRTATCRCAC